MKTYFIKLISLIISLFTLIKDKFEPIVSKKSGYGWTPDVPDHRDLSYQAPTSATATKIDLRTTCPIVYDQGNLGSCTSNAVGGNFEFMQKKEKIAEFMPSRLFIYYNERVIEGTVSSDSGAEIRTSIKAVVNNGVCPESSWKYIISKFKTKPPTSCYTTALKHTAVQYLRLTQDLTSMKACLNSGYPFIFGFSVYDSFESDAVAANGIVPMPGKNESCLGGHAVMAVGYDDSKKWFIIRNSWGPNWGDKGYFYMPYDYITNSNLADDFWTIRLVK